MCEHASAEIKTSLLTPLRVAAQEGRSEGDPVPQNPGETRPAGKYGFKR